MLHKILIWSKKIILQTSWYGNTIAVLWFLAILAKQLVLFLSSQVLFREATRGATVLHYLAYLISDFLIFFVLVALVLINTWIKRKWWRIGIAILALAILIFFVIDMTSLYMFQSSLSLLDISSGVLDVSTVKPSRNMLAMTCSIIVVCLSIFLFSHSKFFKKYKKSLLATVISIFALLSLVASILARPWFRLPENILSRSRSAIAWYIEGWLSLAPIDHDAYLAYLTDVPSQAARPNIIIVFAESFSAIDSYKIAGTYDNLPYFDKIQSDGMSFSNFLSNGCTSDTAHIALLEGVEPRKFAWQEGNAYTGYKIPTAPLGSFFAQEGYKTLFLSTANLEFLDQKSFLSWVWFQTIIWPERFEGQKKYVFDAAPDQVLYKEALSIVQQQTAPYLMTLQTISFHKPYDTPYGKNESAALRYADKTLYFFYQQLKQNWFFDNGLLIIVGDHRKMEPLTEKEKEALGPLRYARALATVVGTGILPGTNNPNLIQHTDFFYSLKNLVGKWKVTVSTLYNDVFGHQQGRDRWVVFCRYFANRYGIVSKTTSWEAFPYITDLKSAYPSIYSYIQAYSDYQQTTPSHLTGKQHTGYSNMAIIGHRGSPLAVTENSLAGFLLAKKHDAEGIELDVTRTKDGQNIVMHGPSTYNTSCGKNILIWTHDLAWLQERCPLTNGEKIMTLEEMLSQIKGLFTYVFVEIKANTKDVEQQTLDAIATVKKLWMEHEVIFISYDKIATYIIGASSNIQAWRDTYNVADLDQIPYFSHKYYLLDTSLVNEDTAQQIAEMGKKLVVYVVNTRDDLEKAYYQWVPIIMTDDVVTMKEYLDKLVLDQK